MMARLEATESIECGGVDVTLYSYIGCFTLVIVNEECIWNILWY